MTARSAPAVLWWLECDVPGCDATSQTMPSEGAAVNEAVEDMWRTYGPGRHVCWRDDHAHDRAAERFARERDEEVQRG